MNVFLQTTQFQYREDAVTHVLRADDPLGTRTIVVPSTEADIRAQMAVPGDNWGNDDALADCQAKIDDLYPGGGITVLLDPTQEVVAPSIELPTVLGRPVATP